MCRRATGAQATHRTIRALSRRRKGSYIEVGAPPIVRDVPEAFRPRLPPSDWPQLCMTTARWPSCACRQASANWAYVRGDLIDIVSGELARQFQVPAQAEGRQARIRLFQPRGGRGERP